MNDWDWVLLGLAAYVAVMGLVRMMRAHERLLLAELQAEFQRQSKASGSETADRAA